MKFAPITHRRVAFLVLAGIALVWTTPVAAHSVNKPLWRFLWRNASPGYGRRATASDHWAQLAGRPARAKAGEVDLTCVSTRLTCRRYRRNIRKSQRFHFVGKQNLVHRPWPSGRSRNSNSPTGPRCDLSALRIHPWIREHGGCCAVGCVAHVPAGCRDIGPDADRRRSRHRRLSKTAVAKNCRPRRRKLGRCDRVC